MMSYPGAELELQRRRDLDRVASEGAQRRRWVLEARAATTGAKKPAPGEPIFWALPDWKPGWKKQGGMA